MKIDFPNRDWYLASKSERNPPFNSYTFRWNSEEDSEEKRAEVWVYIKDIEKTGNVFTLVAADRVMADVNRIEELFTKESGLINLDNAIAYKIKPSKGRFDIDHETYAIYTIREGMGIVFYLTFTSNIKTKIIPQILIIMKSIRVD